MSHYLIQFGHSPKLARLELATYLTRIKTKFQQSTLSPSLHLITTKAPIDAKSLVMSLGGVVRIAKEIRTVDPEFLAQSVATILIKSATKPTFSISSPDEDMAVLTLMSSVKAELKAQGHSSRFVAADHGFLAPIQIQSQSITEFIIVPSPSHQLSIYQTLAVTDYKSWVARDRHRPAVDPQSGMLPPKVARIMVNLGLSQAIAQDTTIYDPFCGSGTIIAEALALGVNVIGSDIDPVAVENSRQNLEWLTNTFTLSKHFQLFAADAKTITPKNLSTPISAIITEVDLGPASHQSFDDLNHTISTLRSLYQQVLPTLRTLLPPRGRLVIALPKHRSPNSVKMLQALVDTCENAGYTLNSGPLLYSQPGARVQRAIYIFENTF